MLCFAGGMSVMMARTSDSLPTIASEHLLMCGVKRTVHQLWEFVSK